MKLQNAEKDWLVRSANQILGPYTVEELTHLLQIKQLSILDEVCKPLARWSYIRENKVFLEVVKKIKKEQDQLFEPTQSSATSTWTNTKTDLVDAPIHEKPAIIPSQEVKIKSTTDVKHYGLEKTQNSKKKMYSRWMLQTVVGVGVVAGLLYFAFQSYQDRKKEMLFSEYTKQALYYKEVFLFDKSLSAYKKASSLKKVNLDLDLKLAALFISEDRQTLYSKQVLNKKLEQLNLDPKLAMEYLLSLVQAGFIDNDLDAVSEYIKKLELYAPDNPWVLLNKAQLLFRQQNFNQSIEVIQSIDFEKSNNKSFFWGADVQHLQDYSYLLEALILAQMPINQTSTKEHIQTWFKRLDLNYKDIKYRYLANEQILLKVFLAHRLFDLPNLELALKQYIEMPFSDKNQFVKDPYLDMSLFYSENLFKYCKEVFENNNKNLLAKSFFSLCLLQNNFEMDAKKYLDEVLAEAPNETDTHSTYLHFLYKSGKSIEADSFLKNLSEKNGQLKQYFLLQSCLSSNQLDCLESIYESGESKSTKWPQLFSSLSWKYIEKNQRFKAYETIKEGLNLFPLYLPLLELRDYLENKQ